MSRKISTKKRFSTSDFNYESLLVNLLINRILKNGKKLLAKKIVYESLLVIEAKLNQNPILTLEKAIRNVTPRIQLTPTRMGGITRQVPTLITKFRSTNIATKWVIEFAKKRPGKGISLKLAQEIIDASKGTGNSIKKKEEIHKMAESNKVFAYLS